MMPDSQQELSPFARSLGIEMMDGENGAPVMTIDYSDDVEGRPGHLHGGAISGLLETAGYALLRAELERMGRKHRLKPINITVQFLAGGKELRTFARGRITKIGRRNANIAVEAWQDNRDRPIATAIMNILMADPEA